MKRLLLLSIVLLSVGVAFAEVNMPSAPSFRTPTGATTSTPSSAYLYH